MEKREITLKIGETKEQAQRRVYKSKQLQKRISLIEKLGIGVVTASIVIGAAGHSIISNMVTDAKNAKDTKEAIQMAAESEEYLRNLKANPVMSQIVEQASLKQLEQLNNAITTYKNLKEKRERSFNEEEAYLNACNVIGESRTLVTENYHDVIRKKIAEAYGINDPSKVRQISAYYDEIFSGNILSRLVEVRLPDGNVDKYAMGTFSDGKVDSELVEQIKNSDKLIGQGYPKDVSTQESEKAIENIIENYEASMDFYSNYKVEKTKNGKLNVSKIKNISKDHEKSKAQDDSMEIG